MKCLENIKTFVKLKTIKALLILFGVLKLSFH